MPQAVLESRFIDRSKLLRTASALSLITIFYNIIEGVVSVYFGADDESLALFGFGIDSFVEVFSGVGVAHMIWRMQRSKNSDVDQDRFEKTALRITGIGFYILTVGLPIGALPGIWMQHRPETTVPGLIISLISIGTMWLLIREKRRVGVALDSSAILADANCTKTCLYLSFVLLAAALLYEAFHIPYVDAVGSLAIAWFAFREGREAFEKAQTGKSCGCDSCH